LPAADSTLVLDVDGGQTSVPPSLLADVLSNQSCPNRYSITRTYRATDACGNVTDQSQIITVDDQTGPQITLFPANVTVGCASAVPVADINLVQATDTCGGAVTISVLADVLKIGRASSRESMKTSYGATDVSGN